MRRLLRIAHDKLWALELSLGRKDRAQAKLLRDLSEVIGQLEIEVLTAIDETERRKLCVDQE